MDKGRIIINITKNIVESTFNSKWNVMLDGRFVGNVDFETSLILSVPNGFHVVQLEVGIQETDNLEVEVHGNDVIVECAYDGTLDNFYVVESNIVCTESTIVNTNAIATMNTAKKKVNVWAIVACICLVLGLIGTFGGDESENSKNEKADFGITLGEYIRNVEGTGVNNLQYHSKTEVDDGMGYLYKHGDRTIFIYTRSNGNVYKVIYNDTGFEYGVQQVSTMILKLAAEFLSATKVSESQSTIYTAIYDCLLMGGSGGTYEFDDCTIGYSRTLVEYYESAWIEAK